MLSDQIYDVAIVGGGIVGAATALKLAASPRLRLIVLEAEHRVAAHQTGHNSGVIHSGLYYKPGSLKALNCVRGREEMFAFCAAHAIPHERCGKVVVALDAADLPRLEELERRGQANGLRGVRRLSAAELREREPAAAGIAGLWVPETGIVDYTRVLVKYHELIRAAGHEVVMGARVFACRRGGPGKAAGPAAGEMTLETTAGRIRCRNLITCAGLQSDRVACLAGESSPVQIIPFRGEYYNLAPERRSLVRSLIYPVPDPRFPFLGVHFTRRVDGSVEAGPNAVLAFRREGYSRLSFSPRDTLAFLAFPGFWRMSARYWRTGLGESYRSFSKAAFVAALRRLMPAITSADVTRGGAGVRAQALDRTGRLIDDFLLMESPHALHVLNAPSPAATASLAIAQTLATRARANFGLD